MTEKQPIPVEIHWGDKIYRFASAAEALKAGFHVPQEPPPPADKGTKK